MIIAVSTDGIIQADAEYEAKASGELMRVIAPTCFRSEQADANKPYITDKRITFIGHGSRNGQRIGAHNEFSDLGWTAQEFFDHLTQDCKLPTTVQVIDLVGCNIGLKKLGRNSFVEKFATCLHGDERYKHITVNAVMHYDRLDKKKCLLVSRYQTTKKVMAVVFDEKQYPKHRKYRLAIKKIEKALRQHGEIALLNGNRTRCVSELKQIPEKIEKLKKRMASGAESAQGEVSGQEDKQSKELRKKIEKLNKQIEPLTAQIKILNVQIQNKEGILVIKDKGVAELPARLKALKSADKTLREGAKMVDKTYSSIREMLQDSLINQAIKAKPATEELKERKKASSSSSSVSGSGRQKRALSAEDIQQAAAPASVPKKRRITRRHSR